MSGGAERVRLDVRMPVALAGRLAVAAEAQGEPMVTIIRRALYEYLDRYADMHPDIQRIVTRPLDPGDTRDCGPTALADGLNAFEQIKTEAGRG